MAKLMVKLVKPQRKSSYSNQRPYINDHYFVIEEMTIKNWENPLILQKLLLELNHRKTEWAIDLRDKIEEKLGRTQIGMFYLP